MTSSDRHWNQGNFLLTRFHSRRCSLSRSMPRSFSRQATQSENPDPRIYRFFIRGGPESWAMGAPAWPGHPARRAGQRPDPGLPPTSRPWIGRGRPNPRQGAPAGPPAGRSGASQPLRVPDAGGTGAWFYPNADMAARAFPGPGRTMNTLASAQPWPIIIPS